MNNKALILIQCGLWQIHRNIDKETDDPELLPPKKIVDTPVFLDFNLPKSPQKIGKSMNAKLFIFLVVSVPLYAIDQEENELKEAFRAEASFFSEEVNTEYKKIAQNFIYATENQNSDYAQACKECCSTDLHGLYKDQAVAEKAKQYWVMISEDPETLASYNRACTASQSHESLENRTKLFTTFRQAGSEKIKELINTQINKDITIPKMEPKNTFALRLILDNCNVTLDDKQKVNFKALTLLNHVLRQIHRNIDEETDNLELLLPKKTTD